MKTLLLLAALTLSGCTLHYVPPAAAAPAAGAAVTKQEVRREIRRERWRARHRACCNI